MPILRNGRILEFSAEGFELMDQYAPHRAMTIDGSLVGMTRENHMHDRYQLQLNGVVVVSIGKRKGDYLIRTECRGMVALEQFPKLLSKIEEMIRNALQKDSEKFADVEQFKKFVAKKTGDAIFTAIGKEPIVVVTVH